MAIVDHPIGQRIEANKALLERLFWHMIGIVNLKHRSEMGPSGQPIAWQEIGTGAACQFHGQRMILTARHNIENSNASELRFLPRQTGRIEWADETKRTMGKRIDLPVRRIVLCEWEDLAAIVLEDTLSEEVLIEFCALPDKLHDPPNQGNCVVIGYPYDQTFPVEEIPQGNVVLHNLSAKSDGFYGEIVTTNKALKDFNPENHFLIKFYPSHSGGKPYGYSGAGVWFPDQENLNDAIWQSNVFLAGIQTHGYIDSQLLRVVKASVVLKFLEEAFPLSI